MQQPARVAVLESRSQAEHYPEISVRGALSWGQAPWIEYEWFDEDQLDALDTGLRQSRFSALVIASGAMQLPRIASYLNSDEAVRLVQGLVARGMGLIVDHTFCPRGETVALSFLPAEMDVWLSPAIDGGIPDVTFDAGLTERIAAMREEGLWVEPEPTPGESRPIFASVASSPTSRHDVLARGKDGQVTMVRSAGTHGKAFVSTVGLDANRHPALYLAILRAVRPSGILFVRHPEDADDRSYREWLAGQPRFAHLVEVAGPVTGVDHEAQTLFSLFSHVVYGPPATWIDVRDLDDDLLRRRLEDHGSVTALTASGDGQYHWLSLSGRTRATKRATQFAKWVDESGNAIRRSPLLVLRAVTACALAARAGVRDPACLPATATTEFLGAELGDALEARLCGARLDNVDDLLAPTAALLRISDDLSITRSSRRQMLAWMRKRIGDASAASVLQAATWVVELQTEPRVSDVLDAAMAEPEFTYHFSKAIPLLALMRPDSFRDAEILARVQRFLDADEAEVSTLAKATLAEGVLSAVAGWSDRSLAASVSSLIRGASGALREAARECDNQATSETYLLAIAVMLRLEAESRLGFKDLGLGVGDHAAPTNGQDEAEVRASAQYRQLDARRRELEVSSRNLRDRTERAVTTGQWLLAYSLVSTLALVGLGVTFFWAQVQVFWNTNAAAKDLMLLAVPLLIAASWFVFRSVFDRAGFVPFWLGGTRVRDTESTPVPVLANAEDAER